KVNAKIANAELATAMNMLLKDLPLVWTLEDETIIIAHKPHLVSRDERVLVRNLLQQVSVRGRITDEANNALPGVTVSLKGTSIAVTTDEDGNYQIGLPSQTGTLVFNMLGFESQEQPV